MSVYTNNNGDVLPRKPMLSDYKDWFWCTLFKRIELRDDTYCFECGEDIPRLTVVFYIEMHLGGGGSATCPVCESCASKLFGADVVGKCK